ncbi:MAG: ATP-binding protein [Sporichthyaceae bacterium]
MEIRVLGPVELVADGRAVPVGGPKERALLARLALSAGAFLSVHQLIDDLWGQARPADPTSALQVHVSRLRRVLRGLDRPPVLAGDAGGYRLVMDSSAVDATRFDLGCARALKAARDGDLPGAATAWRDALALWRGPALADALGVPFASLEAGRLEEGRLLAVEGRVAADLGCGRAAPVVGELELLTRTHPLRERLWALRMLALYRCGRQAEALATYGQVRAALAEELGLEPGPALRRLQAAILAHDAALDLAGFDPLSGEPLRPQPAVPVAAEPVAAALDRTVFVGRDSERGLLRRLLEQAVAGTGSLVLVGGEPGVGKTRLAAEVAAEAARNGAWSATGHCYEAAGAPPFVALVEILEAALAAAPSPTAWRGFLGDEAPEVAKLVPVLRRWCPDIPDAFDLPAEQERRLLFNSLVEVLARTAERRSVLLVLDDLQWADEPTLRFVEHLADRLSGLPVLVVANYRDTEVDPDTAVARTFEHLRRRRAAHWVTLDRLDDAEVRLMLETLSGLTVSPTFARSVHARTEGNPFFVEEIYRHLHEQGRLLAHDGCLRTDDVSGFDLPAGVRLATGRRLARLDPGTVPLLTLAAVAGRTFSTELLELLVADPDTLLDSLEDALRARLILPLYDPSGADRFLFTHELIRATLLADVTLTRRRRLHAAVADALERRHRDALDPQAASIAAHLVESGPHGAARAFAHLIRAGRFATATAAFEEALVHYERAAAVAAGSERDRAELAFELGTALANVGRFDAAVESWSGAVEAFVLLGDADAMGDVCVVACYHLVFLGRWDDALGIGRRGLDVLPEGLARGRLLAMTAFPLAYVGGHGEAEAMVAESLAIAERLDDDVLRAHAQFGRAMVHTAHARMGEVVAAGQEATRLFAAVGDTWNALLAAGFVSYGLTCLGRFAECTAWVARYLPTADQLGNVTAGSQLRRMGGLIDVCACGDLERLAELGRIDRGYVESTGMPWASGWSWQGMAEHLRGVPDAAAPLFAEAHRREPAGALRGWNAAVYFEFLAYRGDSMRALELLEICPLPGPDAESWTWGAACMLVAAVDGLTMLGHRERAAALYPTLCELHERTGLVTTGYDDARLWERAAGIAAMAGKQWDLAERHFLAALRQAAELPHRFEEAHTRRWYGGMLLERGDREQGETLLQAAIADYERMGIPHHRELCARLLRG